MNGTITIENLTERHIQYRIEHQVVCVKTGKCLCKKGRRGPVATSIHVPGGKGMKAEGVPSALLRLPQVQTDKSGKKPRIKIHAPLALVEETREQLEGTGEPGNDSFPNDESNEGESGKKVGAKSTKPKNKNGGGGRQGKNK